MPTHTHEIVAVGGGMTGFAAAVAAARRGRDVLLIERYSCLGGMATVGLVNPWMFHYTWDRFDQDGQEVIRGIYAELLEKMEAQGAIAKGKGVHPGNRAFDSEVLKWTLDEMALEAGVKLRFHTWCDAVVCEDRKLQAVETTSKSGKERFEAEVFIDTTGDGDLAHLSGCEMVFGRESDHKAQAMTTMFRLTDFDADRGPDIGLFFEAVKSGRLKRPGKKHCLLNFRYPGNAVLSFNQNEIAGFSGVDAEDLTRAEIEGRAAIRELVGWMREEMPGFENCRVEQIAHHVGLRETRRIVGRHVLSVEDLLATRRFEDTVACGAYPVDIHDPEGKGEGIPMRKLGCGEYYDLPYRSFLPSQRDNLLVAGRCLSAEHKAAAAVRVMPICTAMGQAVGTAACLAVESGTPAPNVDIPELQKRLLQDGAFLGFPTGSHR